MLAPVNELFPITYGHKAPNGFGGKPDCKQQRFNRMVHLSQWPHDASIAEFNDNLVVHIPSGHVWCHWLAFGKFPDRYMATSKDAEILDTLARFHAITKAYGCDRQEFSARVKLCNELVDEEWLIDYAEREGMTLEGARATVNEGRKWAAKAAGKVGGHVVEKSYGVMRHEFSWYESHCKPLIAKHDVVDHDWRQSYECIRERIEHERKEREESRKTLKGLTIADMSAAGVSYSDISDKEGYRVDESTAEIVVVRLRNDKVVRRTGRYVERLLDGKKPAATKKDEPKPSPKGPVAVNKDEPKKPSAPKVVREPIDEVNPLEGVVNRRPKDRSGWAGTRKRRSCVTRKDAWDSAEGCRAIGAMFSR